MDLRPTCRAAALLLVLLPLPAQAGVRLGQHGSYLGIPSYRPTSPEWSGFLRHAMRAPDHLPGARFAPIGDVLERSGVSFGTFLTYGKEHQDELIAQAEAAARREIDLAAASAFARLGRLARDSISSHEAALIGADLGRLSGELRPYLRPAMAAAADIGLDIIGRQSERDAITDRAGEKLTALARSLVEGSRIGLEDDAPQGSLTAAASGGLRPAGAPLLIAELGAPPAPFRSPPNLERELRRSLRWEKAYLLAAGIWAGALPYAATGDPFDSLFTAVLGSLGGWRLVEGLHSRLVPKGGASASSADWLSLAQRAGIRRRILFETIPSQGAQEAFAAERDGETVAALDSEIESWAEPVRGAVAAHELGHVRFQDSRQSKRIAQGYAAAIASYATGWASVLASAFSNPSLSLGALPLPGRWTAVFVLLLLGAALYNLRRQKLTETRADLFAAWLTHPAWVKTAFRWLKDNDRLRGLIDRAAGESPVRPDLPLSHPTLEERIEAVDAYAAERTVELPKLMTARRLAGLLLSRRP